MTDDHWRKACGLESGDDAAWELFHEASKLGRYGDFPSQESIVARMSELLSSLPFDDYPEVKLPTRLTPLRLSLSEAILSRQSARDLAPATLSLEDTATLLHHGYGITRGNEGTGFLRPFRAAPSGGALYPLEVFVHSTRIEGEKPGLYHYNPTRNSLRLLREGDQTARIAEMLVPFQAHQAFRASLVIFLAAFFERSTFKYGDRGYRFVLLEAGHVAQNLNLVANGLGLCALNIGGFFDRQADALLDLSGLAHSTVYMIAIGKETPALASEGNPPGGHEHP